MYLGKMIEVTREAPANLGTAMKTIIARFEDMKKDPMAILEDGVSANKVEAALATIGIALRDTAGEFRPLQDVMDELGMKWDSLTRNQQAYIATVAAGSRQQSRFLALMNNYDRTLDLINESQNSAGAAAEQYSIYQDSAAAATARLTAAWEEFYSKIVNSEQIIWVINALEKLVETMSKIGPVGTAIGTTIGALGLNLLGKAIIPNITKSLADVASTGQVASLSIGALAKGGGALLLTFGKVAAVIAVVVGAVWLAVKAYQALDKVFHKNREEAKALNEEIGKLNKEISNSDTKINSLEKLLKQYDELNKKVYLTEEEQKELNDTILEIENVSERAIISIDEIGNAHLRNRDAISAELEQEKEIQAWRESQRLEKEIEWISNPESEKNPENLQNNGFVNMARVEATRPTISEDKINTAAENLDILKKAIKDADIKQLFEIYGEELNSSLEKAINNFKTDYLQYDNINSFEALLDKYIEGIVSEEEWEGFLNILQQVIDEEKGYSETIQHGKQVQEDYNNAMVEAATLDYTNKALEYSKSQQYISPKASIITEAMENGAFQFDTIDDLLNFYNNFDNFINNDELIKKLDKFNKSNHDTKAFEELQNDLAQAEISLAVAVGKKIIQDAEDAAKEQENQKNKISQFISDIKEKNFADDDLLKYWEENGDFTDSEIDKGKQISNSNLLNNDQKKTIMGLFSESNNELDTLIDQYIDYISKGMYDKADEIREILLTIFEGDEKLVSRLLSMFIPQFQDEADKRLSQATENYETAKSIYNKDSTEALTDKEYGFLQQQNSNIDKYISINEQGEKYLSILGKINVLENARADYLNAQGNQIISNNEEISQHQFYIELAKEEIEKSNEELSKSKDIQDDSKILTKEEIEARKDLIQQEENRINELNNENKLLDSQLQKEIDIVNETANMTMISNLTEAEKYANNIEKIGKALKEAGENSGRLFNDTAISLIQMNSEYGQMLEYVDGYYTLSADAAQQMVDKQIEGYEIWRQEEENKLLFQRTLLENQLKAIQNYLSTEASMRTEEQKQELINNQNAINSELGQEKDKGDKTSTQNIEMLNGLRDQYKEYYTYLANADAKFKEGLTSLNGVNLDEVLAQMVGDFTGFTVEKQTIEIGDIDFTLPEDELEKALEEEAEQLAEQIALIDISLENLKNLSPALQDTFDNAITEAAKGGTKALQDLNKIIEDTIKAIEDLDNLVKDLKESFKDITIDIDPFTELFEEWEHEWDYFFNIKNFIGNKQRSRNLFSRIADAEWASPEDRLAMDDAIIGSYVGEFAARREYAEGLMADIVQKGTDMTEKYGQFGTFDPETMTWYQKDDQLVKINEEQAQRVENINNLQKQQWEKNNELAAEEANLELLESKKDAYEDALSTINDTIESLKEKEGIEADTSALEDEKKKLEDNLKATEDGIEAQKDSIEDLKEEIKKIDFDLWAEQDAYDFWDNFVNGMDDDISSLQAEIEEYFGNIDAMYEDIEGAWAQYTKYLEATMNTQQQLFDAIVENYQKEIDAKKKEYDELKRLDNEYLQSVKDNIAKEREAREDSKKQKSYQQSLQRAQLLQMDTSGAFRTELNELKNSIEQQREDLYDDLVDKQVEALEKEIEKRHELYDKEVAALEERLAYMQENASLLWEMVNEIVAQGSGAMMSTLEGTAEYMNSSELQREQLRNQWQYNTLASIKFTTDQWGKNQELMIKAMGEIAETAYPNYKKEVEDNTEVLKKLNQSIEDYKNSIIQGKVDVDDAMSSLVSSLSTEFTNYMNGWAVATSTLTGNVTVYGTAVNDMINSLSTNIQTLDGWNSGLSTSGGKIIKTIETYDEELAKKYAEIYKDYEDERNKYQGELDSLIQEIQEEISSAVEDAAEAIRKAVDSLTAGSGSGNGEGSGGDGSGNGNNTPTNPKPSPGGGNEDEKRYRLRVWDQQGNALFSSYGTKAEVESWYQKAVSNPDLINAVPGINLIYKLWRGSEIISFLKGGLANFTGPAWLDGTASSPERVLSPHQTKLFESMVSSLERASNNSNINSALGSSYNIGDINTSIQVAKLDNQTDINQLAKQVEDKIVKTIRNRVTISV